MAVAVWYHDDQGQKHFLPSDNNDIDACAHLCWKLLTLPNFSYCRSGWETREFEIINIFSTQASFVAVTIPLKIIVIVVNTFTVTIHLFSTKRKLKLGDSLSHLQLIISVFCITNTITSNATKKSIFPPPSSPSSSPPSSPTSSPPSSPTSSPPSPPPSSLSSWAAEHSTTLSRKGSKGDESSS